MAWWLAGDGHRADLAVLEADDLDPSLGLVPDPWGLWPMAGDAKVPTPLEQRVDAAAPVARIRRWRWLESAALPRTGGRGPDRLDAGPHQPGAG
jgi:hypothetical protein